MLTTAQLAGMRADANRLLDKMATVYRRTLTTDSSGGQADSYTALPGTVACRLSATSVKSRARDMARGERIEAAEGWMVSLPIGADVVETDRLLIGAITYEVVSAADPRSYEVNLRLIVKRV
jgi:hypothetical protein